MTTTTLTITRVMASLKSLDTRLTQAITSGPYLALSKGSTDPALQNSPYADVAAFEKATKANYDSIVKLIDNRNKLRSALTQSNATVKVKVGGVERSIAETLEYRRSVVPVMTSFIDLLKAQLRAFTMQKDNADKQLEETIERQSMGMTGQGTTKADPAFLENLRRQLESNLKVNLVDPLGLSAVIEKHQKELDNFLLEVDYVLSEINATTTVDVDLAG